MQPKLQVTYDRLFLAQRALHLLEENRINPPRDGRDNKLIGALEYSTILFRGIDVSNNYSRQHSLVAL